MTACLWCKQFFAPRMSGGKRQRFCQPLCRRAYETAARRYVDWAIAAGTVSIADLKASPATRALVPVGEKPPAGIRSSLPHPRSNHAGWETGRCVMANRTPKRKQ